MLLKSNFCFELGSGNKEHKLKITIIIFIINTKKNPTFKKLKILPAQSNS